MQVLSPELVALAVVGFLAVFLAAMVWLFNVRWREFVSNEPPPKLPCPHRFVRVRYTVDPKGVAGRPEPVCGDCGQPVGNVKLRLADDHELQPDEPKGAAVITIRKKDT